MSIETQPVAVWHRPDAGSGPIVVLLHGRGSSESDIIGLAQHLPSGPNYVALRAPIVEGGGYAWFANRGIGRPVAESLGEVISWFREWVDEVAGDRPVVLVGFSGGATFAGGVALDDPSRLAGLATLYATLPFDAGVPTTPGRLTGLEVLVAQGDADQVIPVELQSRTWEYLHNESGATLTATRSPGGHGLTQDVAEVLRTWITSIVEPAGLEKE